MMTRHLCRAALVMVALSALLLPASPAVASCAEDAGPEGSPVIFVGTVDAERRGYTQFSVDEVRAGPDLAPDVWVRSGQEQPTWPLNLLLAVSSSDDADFVRGHRYVVGASRTFDTGACSVAESNESAADADGRRPVAGGAQGADPPIGLAGQTLWVAGVLAAVASAVLLVRRLRRAAIV